MSGLSTYWRRLARGTACNPLDRLVLALLVPLSLPYGWFQRLRASLYRRGILRRRRLPRPVISIGNLTVGGTGKTPLAALIARQLLAQGLKVVLLSRGYGGSREGEIALVSDGSRLLMTARESGDEPYLLATTVPGLAVVIGSDRHAAGELALSRLCPDVFLLDDGFQHLRLWRDLDILLLDYRHPFGNGYTLPAGLLREPPSAADRADLIIRTRCPAPPLPSTDHHSPPLCHSRHELAGGLVPLRGGGPIRFEQLAGARVVAVAGIAEPQPFFEALRDRGLTLAACIGLPDHARYEAGRVEQLRQTLLSSRAEWLVTTEKDGVKLLDLPDDLSQKTLLAPLCLSLDDPAPLTSALRNLLQK